MKKEDGTVVESQKFVWKGIGGKKSNSPLISKDLQENLLKLGCDGQGKDKTLPFLRSIVDRARDCIKKQLCPYCNSKEIEILDDGKGVRKDYKTSDKFFDDSLSILGCKSCGETFKYDDMNYDVNKLMEIGIPHNFGRDFDSYKTKDSAFRAARYIKKNLGVPLHGAGDTVLYYYISSVASGKYPETDVMAVNPENPVFPRDFTIDEDIMLSKIVLAKINMIIPFIDIRWNEIIDPLSKKRID